MYRKTKARNRKLRNGALNYESVLHAVRGNESHRNATNREYLSLSMRREKRLKRIRINTF